MSKAPEINKNHSFKLTKGGARTYYMCAGSESDMKKWMMAMMDAAKVSSTDVCTKLSILGSIEVTTYPSPKSQFCPNRVVSVNVDLGEGWVVTYPETSFCY